MQTVNELLINLDLIKQHKKDFWLTLILQRQQGFLVNWDTSTYRCGENINIDNRALSVLTGFHINTIRKYTNEYISTYEYAGSFSIIPNETYDRLVMETQMLTAAEKNGIIRTFCYFVCMCWSLRDFSRTKENIAKDLDNKLVDVIRRVKWLVEHKFIFIKHQHVHFPNAESKACVYQLYIDEVPPNYARTEWWVGHLAARETASIDDILTNFKNSF